MYMVWVQPWIKWTSATENRPDGFSLHTVKCHVSYFIERHRQSLPSIYPREYSMPFGDPYLEEVDPDTYEQVKSAKSTFGIRCDTRFAKNRKIWVARTKIASEFNPIRPSE